MYPNPVPVHKDAMRCGIWQPTRWIWRNPFSGV